MSDATPLAAAMARCWISLPYASERSFLAAIALSAAGRSRWNTWPAISGDDIFVAATIPADLQLVVSEAVATMQPPLDFRSWIQARARWIRGEKQLRAMGLAPPAAHNQRMALLKRLVTPSTMLGATAFAFAFARAAAGIPGSDDQSASWRPQRRRP